ncbi:transporter substrate-binding domain-containing protein [Niveibacterium sp. 24ML]|uniref:substrate-binding periplasmic protein n=1 Tax=Niveibacterium sp. 24ML TaxID=2985512 RepID=UPI002271DF97|nr:transporter substrate-binding domain-containing protein [Niveibacterium sp. 24ML]MCX9155665.1 transporter substrate-binding domain-containing protein [Niveibacterium sp. 24ML]
MKHAFLGLLLALGVCSARAGEAQALLTVVGDHAPPFRIFGASEPGGIYFDLARALARRAGYRVRFVEVPSARALAMMRAGEADLMIGLLQTPDREAFLHYLSPSLPPVDKRILLRSGVPLSVEQYADLQRLTIGVERGKSYSPQFDHDALLNKDVSDTYAIALKKLQAGRVDAVVIPEAEADWLMREMGQRFPKASYRISGLPTFVVFARASPNAHLLPRLEQALRELAANDEFSAIARSYR